MVFVCVIWAEVLCALKELKLKLETAYGQGRVRASFKTRPGPTKKSGE